MKSIITKGLEPDMALEIKGAFTASHRLRKVLIDIFNEKIEEERTRVRLNYENPSWEKEMAKLFGYEEALKEVISILSEKNT
jgi:hypothetical protein